ncbi:hypothetical protein [Thalassospira sp.]|uniref:DUF6953 family protein n=1 Tax=Thalassospira sp. TaxID=1912094 RepID=UPI000C4AD623|nr:hypothetical protein [Thalassospira sp.]MAL40561.1 hypothetical protein [Thalassospira sp.]HAY50368.1 hypothetical protein [Thalassospira sp.]|tara:strand:+ start:640 stop:897 length:258 start_codon:yes stop_codon:yes gene_type:complete
MTPREAAEWMLTQFEAKRFLYQEEAASHLLHLHNEALTYYNGSGNLCLGKEVLKEFNSLTKHAVYERSGKFWRDRLPSDQPGRQQ